MLFNMKVIVKGKPDFSTIVEAENEWKARTRVMCVYPYHLAGDFVDYEVTEALDNPIAGFGPRPTKEIRK